MLFTCSVYCIALNLYGQSTPEDYDIYFDKLTTKDGLSNNVVKCFFQDHTGFLWIGTADGLNRYDGKVFKVFKTDAYNDNSISGNIITGIAEDKKGKLWITTQDGGLCSYNYKAAVKQFEQYQHDPNNKKSIPANNLNALAVDGNDNVWIASENSGVFKLDIQTKKFRSISNLETDPRVEGFTYGCDVMKMDDEGYIWGGLYGDLLMRINPWKHSTKDYLHFETKQGVKIIGGAVHAILPDKNFVWFAQKFGSVDKVNYKTGEFEHYNLGPENIGKKQTDHWVSMQKDSRGNIWAASLQNGCYVFDTAAHRFYNFRYKALNPASISSNTVNCLYNDKAGIMWVGTNKGICKYDPQANQIKYHYVTDEKNDIPEKLNIYDFYEAEDGSFWLATDGGLYIREKNETSFKCKYLAYNGKPLIIFRFWKTTNGKIYLITKGRNLLFNKQKGTLHEMPFSFDPEQFGDYSYESSIKTSFVEDTINGKKVLWVGSLGWGLFQYDPVKNKCSDIVPVAGYTDLVSSNLIQSVIKDNSGQIWLATNGGGLEQMEFKLPNSWGWHNNIYYGHIPFVHYKNEPANPYSLSSNSLSDMCLDQNGIIWITTYSGVLNRFDRNAKDKKYFTRIVPTASISNEGMFSILPDKHNDLWITTASAILKYSIATNKFSAFKLRDELPYDQYPGKKYTGKDGTIYIGGDKFYLSFHPDSLHENLDTAAVVITGFNLLNKQSDQLLVNDQVKLKPGENFFSFEFAALNFSNPQQNQFAYKLDGINKEWIQNGNKNIATYTNIPPGTYTFHVIAATCNGIWNRKGASVTITVLPAWYQTWFFGIALLVLSAGLIFMATRYYFRQKLKDQQQQFEKELAVENVRTKMSRDIHDEIGAGLTKISLMSQRLKLNAENNKDVDPALLQKITASSKEITDNLGEIIWTVNPKHDNLPSLLAFLRNYIAHFFEDSNIEYFIHFPDEIPQVHINPDLKRNLFLVLKESLNNIAKHSGANKVHILFHYIPNNNRYSFEITDNGKGFKNDDTKNFSNGLTNMKSRMEASRGKFVISSEIDNGTKIIFKGKFHL